MSAVLVGKISSNMANNSARVTLVGSCYDFWDKPRKIVDDKMF